MKSLYRAAWAAALPLARLAALAPGKLGRTVRGRLGALRDIESRLRPSPSLRQSPLLWFHAASVGEGRQALAVIAELKTARPAWRFAYTYGSSSAEAFARSLPVDFAAYLPPDTVRAMGAALDAIRPSALVFAATDVWPELVRQAARRGVPAALVSANLAAGSSRRGALARALLADAYAGLSAVGTIDERDAGRLAELGVPRERIRVTGDSRHDAALARAAAASPARDALLRRLNPAADQPPILAAGSTWPSDERALLPAVAALRRGTPLRLLIAPHEPDPGTLSRLERRLAALLGPEARVRRLAALEDDTASEPPRWDVCLVDRVGVLFDCYAAASVAYVGGAFHAAGLHSVIEPAAFGVPVLFGPRWQGSRDARLLLEAGGGVAASAQPELAGALLAWLAPGPERRTARAAAGAAARAVVERGAGAARRSAGLVTELVERHGAAGHVPLG